MGRIVEKDSLERMGSSYMERNSKDSSLQEMERISCSCSFEVRFVGEYEPSH